MSLPYATEASNMDQKRKYIILYEILQSIKVSRRIETYIWIKIDLRNQ